MIDRFVALLDNAALDLTTDDMADMLWLALQIAAPAGRVGETSAPPAMAPPDQRNRPAGQGHPAGAAPGEAGAQASPRGFFPPGGQEGDPDSAMSQGRPFRAPAAAALPGALGIARALRPFMRRQRSRTRFVLDERATAQRIAEQQIPLIAMPRRPGGGSWSPVLRPAPVRWFEIALVADTSASMVIWRRTLVDLQRLLERHGAFRDVRPWSLITDAADGALHLYGGFG